MIHFNKQGEPASVRVSQENQAGALKPKLLQAQSHDSSTPRKTRRLLMLLQMQRAAEKSSFPVKRPQPRPSFSWTPSSLSGLDRADGESSGEASLRILFSISEVRRLYNTFLT